MCFGRDVLDTADVLEIGDVISLKLMNRLVNFFLPINVDKDCLQLRGQSKERIDRQTNEVRKVYPTFRAITKDEWYYCGRCYLGENVERGDDFVERSSCLVGLGVVL